MWSGAPQRTASGGLPQGASPVIGRRARLLTTLGLKVTRTGAPHGEHGGGGVGGYFGGGYFGSTKRQSTPPPSGTGTNGIRCSREIKGPVSERLTRRRNIASAIGLVTSEEDGWSVAQSTLLCMPPQIVSDA